MKKSAKHILIVEDSPDLQILLAKLFEGQGYKLSQAYDGRQALTLLNGMKDLPSVILLDIMMPVMDGIEFRQKQRMDPRLAGIPVVVMTADSDPQGKASNLGVAHFFKKPIKDINELIEIIETF
jgi:CheY-like chemotaxis protein